MAASASKQITYVWEGKDKKGKPRNGKDRENIEIYEPSGGRTTPGGHAKNKN